MDTQQIQRMCVQTQQQDGLAILRFNRPEKRNAMDDALLDETLAALDEFERDPEIRILIVTGNGSAFSSGADRSLIDSCEDPIERNRLFSQYSDRLASKMGAVFIRLARSRIISIAAINGPAVGGGFLVGLGCDFRVASADARFWFPEIELGRAISRTVVEALVDLAGLAVAKEMVLAARRYTASELMALGLLSRVVPAGDVLPAAREWGRSMVSAVGIGGLAYATAKERLNAPLLSRWTNNRDAAAQAG